MVINVTSARFRSVRELIQTREVWSGTTLLRILRKNSNARSVPWNSIVKITWGFTWQRITTQRHCRANKDFNRVCSRRPCRCVQTVILIKNNNYKVLLIIQNFISVGNVVISHKKYHDARIDSAKNEEKYIFKNLWYRECFHRGA